MWQTLGLGLQKKYIWINIINLEAKIHLKKART